jgi:predicted Fe-Mo cluster-binding NifX family protein
MSDLPKLAAPAQRALAGAGLTSLDKLAKAKEVDVAALHGMGPNAMGKLKEALKAKGKAFRG